MNVQVENFVVRNYERRYVVRRPMRSFKGHSELLWTMETSFFQDQDQDFLRATAATAVTPPQFCLSVCPSATRVD